MTFALPKLLWLLLVPAALLLWELTRRRHSANGAHPKILRAEAGAGSLALVSRARATAVARPWLAFGLMLVIVAAARPQWGRLDEPVFDQSREILLAIDLSRSMLTPDVRPSRLERAKLLTQSLLDRLAGERVGLIVFSGTAFLQCPLSADYEILREFLPPLGPGFMPEGGTNYGALIDTALDAFSSGTAADRFLIILSDGEATDENWRERAAEFQKKGIRVISLGIGTAAGAMIPDGSGAFVKDERGAVVLSKLESSTLRELATLTNGTYRDASSWVDLAGVLNATVEAGRKGQFLEKNTVCLVERFQWPLALGLWCLLVSLYYEFPVRPRPRDIKLAAPTPRPATAAVGAVALLLLLLALSPRLSAATPAAAPDSPLAKIVGRLSGQPAATARDWAEMASETVVWGQNIQSTQQPVPPGPVHDALSAVKLGESLDAKTADWPKLRRDLEALLEKPEDQKKQDQQQQNQDDKNQDQKDQDQSKQGQSKQDSKSSQDQKQQEQSQQQKDQQQQKQDEQQSRDEQSKREKGDHKQEQQSAFGDMKEPPPPPQAKQGETQKVGGAPEKKDGQPLDPAMAVPLQKLDQLRNQDSPAELFQLMDTDKKAAPRKKSKDW